MLNFGASKPRVRGGPGPRGPPLDPHLENVQVTFAIAELVMVLKSIISHILPPFLVKILFHIKT